MLGGTRNRLYLYHNIQNFKYCNVNTCGKCNTFCSSQGLLKIYINYNEQLSTNLWILQLLCSQFLYWAFQYETYLTQYRVLVVVPWNHVVVMVMKN